MPLKITNSLTKQKEALSPLEPGLVKIYACGPTVYDEPHLGHLRSAYVFEVVRNYLKYSKYRVLFARNVTDVDDKIIEKARLAHGNDLKTETVAVAQKYLELYKRDLKRFGIQEPDFEPKATDHIPEMILLIQSLIEKKHAYIAAGDVYFDVGSFPDYGEVSHQKTDRMLEEDTPAEINPAKRNPLDFALWKKAKEEEPYWESPWGNGRPGWHIECSAMSLAYFKGPFDIHGGGRDLIFPHHENENAQSRCALGKRFVNIWLHHGLLTVEGKKMSKSLKNFITLESVLSETPGVGGEILKLTFLGTHYGSPLDYTAQRVRMDGQIWKKFMEFFENARGAEKNGAKLSEKRLPEFYRPFREAMEDDFNTPEVLSLMHGLMRDTYKSSDAIALVTAAAAIRHFGFDVFDLRFDHDVTVAEGVEQEIVRRAEAKKKKDFKTADAIRDGLLKEKNVELRDLPDGRTTWRVKR